MSTAIRGKTFARVGMVGVWAVMAGATIVVAVGSALAAVRDGAVESGTLQRIGVDPTLLLLGPLQGVLQAGYGGMAAGSVLVSVGAWWCLTGIGGAPRP